MNISLMTLAEKGEFDKTGYKPKLPIKIENLEASTLDVYQIPLKYLYYNDENGRIASEVEKDRMEGLEIVADIKNPKYNDHIAKLIQKDNSKRLDETKKDIKVDGQKIFGYVLDDGRIIDGNRRFTALRELQKDKGTSKFFEAVILPFSYEEKIKELELAIQMGVPPRQDYDPVDKAVDIYRTISSELLTPNDYSKKSKIKVKDITTNFDTINLIREFLKFINADQNAYYLIKETGTFSLFFEMSKTLKNEFGKNEESQVRRNETKQTFFVWILSKIRQGAGGTMAYEEREYKKNIIKKKTNSEFNEDVEDIIEDIQDIFHEQDEVTDVSQLSKIITKSEEQFGEFDEIYDDYMDSAKKVKTSIHLLRISKKSLRI